MTLLEQLKQRFAESAELRDGLDNWQDILREYIFSDSVLVQLIEKPASVVVRYLASIDE